MREEPRAALTLTEQALPFLLEYLGGSPRAEGIEMRADALRAVRDRIETGWSQDAHARDAFGKHVPLRSEEAVAWSLSGAFALAGKDGIPMNYLPAALRAVAEVTEMESLNGWNDEAGRTKDEVLDALDAAIAHVEGDAV